MGDVGVVGGGFLGLTSAMRLAQIGHRVTVYEAERNVGGLAQADELGNIRWDRFYHVVLGTDRHLQSLLGEIGLSDSLSWARTRTGFYVDGQWHSMSSALDFLRFPPLSLWDKARLAATILAASRIRDWRELEHVTAIEWLTRWSGRRTVQQIWLPLLRSKLGPNAELASAAFIWAIIVRMYGARQTGMKQESMGYLRGGYDTVLPVLRRHVESLGVRIVTDTPVATVRSTGAGARIELSDGTVDDVDDAILTVSCPRVLAMCPDLAPEELARLRRVVYQGVICPSFLLRRPLKAYYVTNITDPDLPFTAVIEMTALVDPSVFGGRHLVYLPRYLSQNDPLWQERDDAIADRFLAALRAMIPDLQPDDVLARRVARAKEVLAISTLRYSTDSMPHVRTSQPHVFISNSAQIAQGTLNVDETIALAERNVRELDGLLTPARGVAQHA